jgi:hypothetical protein
LGYFQKAYSTAGWKDTTSPQEINDVVHPFAVDGEVPMKLFSAIQKAITYCILRNGGSCPAPMIVRFLKDQWPFCNSDRREHFLIDSNIQLLHIHTAARKNDQYIFIQDPRNQDNFICNSPKGFRPSLVLTTTGRPRLASSMGPLPEKPYQPKAKLNAPPPPAQPTRNDKLSAKVKTEPQPQPQGQPQALPRGRRDHETQSDRPGKSDRGRPSGQARSPPPKAKPPKPEASSPPPRARSPPAVSAAEARSNGEQDTTSPESSTASPEEPKPPPPPPVPHDRTRSFDQVILDSVSAARDGFTLQELTEQLAADLTSPGPFHELQGERRVRAVLIILKSQKKLTFVPESGKWQVFEPHARDVERPIEPQKSSLPAFLSGVKLSEIPLSALYERVKSASDA